MLKTAGVSNRHPTYGVNALRTTEVNIPKEDGP